MKNLSGLIIILGFLNFLTSVADAQIAVGGSNALEQSVVAAGGGSNLTGGAFKLEGTIGQAVAGTSSQGASFNLHGGFWNTAASVAPTAATVSISGRVMTADGRGILGALITLTNGDGTSRTVLSGKFGIFRFAEIAGGQTVIVSVRAKRFSFAAPMQIVFVNEDASEINFVALNELILQSAATSGAKL